MSQNISTISNALSPVKKTNGKSISTTLKITHLSNFTISKTQNTLPVRSIDKKLCRFCDQSNICPKCTTVGNRHNINYICAKKSTP